MLYRASHAITVLAFGDNHQFDVTLPPGSILEVLRPAQDDRFIIVSIKGEEFLVLESDLRTRGEFYPRRAIHTERFKLEKATLAIGDVNGKRVAVTIPAGDIVKLVSKPSLWDKMVDVLWEGRMVAMYAIDLRLRGSSL
jgi:hypothetical protein